MIDFRCTQCGRLLRTPDDAAGKQAQCPSCNAIQPVPEVSVPPASAESVFRSVRRRPRPPRIPTVPRPATPTPERLMIRPRSEWQTPGPIVPQPSRPRRGAVQDMEDCQRSDYLVVLIRARFTWSSARESVRACTLVVQSLRTGANLHGRVSKSSAHWRASRRQVGRDFPVIGKRSIYMLKMAQRSTGVLARFIRRVSVFHPRIR